MDNMQLVHKIQKKYEFLLSIINKYPGPITVTNAKGIVTFCSDRGKLGKFSQKGIQGQSIYKLVKEKEFQGSAIISTLKTKKASVQYVKQSDSNNTFLAASEPIFDEQGNLIYVICFSLSQAIAEEYVKTLEREKQKLRESYNIYFSQYYNNNNTIVAESPAMKELFNFAELIENVTAPVIIYGESGTGKDVLARYIHAHSVISNQILLPINCATIPKDLMESEMFGYEKGTFTGGNKEGKPGIFELANNGTLFLDEIGEMPLDLQVKLLRVLDSGEFKRLGGKSIKKVSVRILAATNRDLKKMVAEGTFREDLYYRLNVIPLFIPPLRERPEDILAITNFFIKKFDKKYNKTTALTENLKMKLMSHTWPGNVRELKNVIERIVIMNGHPDKIALAIDPSTQANSKSVPTRHACPQIPLLPYKKFIEAAEKDYFSQMLQIYKGNVIRMSEDMEIYFSGVYRKLHKYKIIPHEYKEKI